MDFQFYPTPPSLVEKAWAKFKNRDFVRVLEPSAGEAHLAKGHPEYSDRGRHSWGGHQAVIDCIEIDVTKHAYLREVGFNVVGVDFLQFDGAGAMYSHIVMNPPFANGAQHVLKAWDILYDGECICILNAETIRNPFSKERELLVRLVDQHGEVEFIEGAFAGPEAERQTDVDVALVYLRKKASFSKDLAGDILDGLKRERHTGLDAGYQEDHEMVIPGNFVENSVLAFNAAVKAMRESVFAEARAAKYASRMGKSLGELNTDAEKEHEDEDTRSDGSLRWVREAVHERHSKLKAQAWTGILRSTQVLSRLSSSAQKRIESEFETIKILEFSVSNIYGFLSGLIAKQPEINLEMLCDCFDAITRYHTAENAVWYMGWKSNDKHRTAGMRIKMTRFVLPRHHGYSTSFRWETEQLLADFDKAFALLDGKTEPELSLVQAARDNFKELRMGARIDSSYFSIRHYPGVGTIHFFPKSAKLIDRLNKIVGRHRQWLPSEGTRVSDAFWLQYDKAEKFDKEVREEVSKTRRSYWDDPLRRITSGDDQERAMAHEILTGAIATVLEKNGIDPNALLEAPEPSPAIPQLPLLAAA